MKLPHTIILAGGLGTRLREVVDNLPKPMAPVRNRPFLDYQFDWLQKFGCTAVTLSIGHLAEKISDHYGEEYGDLRLHYSVEPSPLGTGGALRKALLGSTAEEVLVLNGDSLFAIDLQEFYSRHTTKSSQCSLALRKVNDASRYGSITTDAADRITAFNEKSTATQPGTINAGVYLINREAFLAQAQPLQQFSIERDFFASRLDTLSIFGFLFNGYFIDIGIPEDYNRAQDEFARFED